MPKHVSWCDIESFYHVRKHIDAYPTLLPEPGPVTYRAKVKLHGTCAGIIIEGDSTVTAMSRSALITPENDNAGFAKWVEQRREQLLPLVTTRGSLVLFGEWCGPGVQKGVAVNKLPERSFAVFAARIIDGFPAEPDFIAEPSRLVKLVSRLPGAYVLPWFNDGEEFVVDWLASAEQLQPVLDRINERVLAVEACDPWVKSVCGEEGTGEGLVFYPTSLSGYRAFSDLCFKAKGAKHQVVAKAKPAQADPQAAANAAAFAEMVVTPARLEQGCRAANVGNLEFEPKNIGTFLAWISKDIIKECTVEMEASSLEQKDAMKACSNRARTWYLDGMKKL